MVFSEVRNEIILYACHDWGMGHVARSIPILEQLINQGNTVYFAGNEKQVKIVSEYLSEIHFLTLKGGGFCFKGTGNWTKEMLRNGGKMLINVQNDRRAVREWVNLYDVTLIISDHRYGFYSKEVPSIFITHQLTLPVKGFQQAANLWHNLQLKKFSEIWVLDNKNHHYAGKLSQTNHNFNLSYLGIQSRFNCEKTINEGYILAVVSGPRPYAEQFFHEVVAYAKKHTFQIKCICPEVYESIDIPSNLTLINQGTWKEMDELFYHCDTILSRSGYTTIMDVARLGKKAIYIPTPGQLEQEYLFELHG